MAESQAVHPVKGALQQAPSPGQERTQGKLALEKLNRRLPEIDRYKVRFGGGVLLAFACWYVVLLWWFKGNTLQANQVFTNSFQFLAAAWAMWFMLPYFLRVEAKQDVGLAMGHDSVDLMAKVDQSIEQRAAKLDAMIDATGKMIRTLEGGEGKLVDRVERVFREEMGKIRAEIHAQKGAAEAELSAALDEGERAASGIGSKPPAASE